MNITKEEVQTLLTVLQEEADIYSEVPESFQEAISLLQSKLEKDDGEPVATQAAAIRTLTFLGYTYHGAEHWKPPLGGSLYPAAYSQGYQQGRADELDGVRKPWIGLTFEEIGHLHQIHSKYQEESMETSGWVDFTRAVEAMIQGRNP